MRDGEGMITARVLIGGLNVFLILFTAVFYWLTPGLTRRDLLFGVTVAPNARQTPEGRRIIRAYRLGVVLIAAVALVAVGAALAFAPESAWQTGVPALAVLLILVADVVPYVLAHRASLGLRAPAGTAGDEPVAREAALRPRRYRDAVPLIWETLPIALIVATAAYLASLYPSAPAIIPMHWSVAGVPNGFAARSVGSFFALMWTQIGIFVLFTAISLLIVRAKTQPGAADTRFRSVTLRVLFFFKSLLILSFGVEAALISHAVVLGVEPPSWSAVVVFGPVLVSVVAILAVAVRMGQGGAKLENTTATQIDRMDDRYWLLGVVYVNRHDPSILVERRFGYGWTLNFGNIWSYIVFGMIVAVPVGFAVLRGVAHAH